MQIKITLYCPDCQSTNVKKNGKKSSPKQNYLCKDCRRQFIGDHALSYKGCHSSLTQKILLMLVRGVGIRDISVIECISISKASNTTCLPKSLLFFKETIESFKGF